MKGDIEHCLWVFVMVPLQDTQQIVKVLLGSLSIAPVYHLRNHFKVFWKKKWFWRLFTNTFREKFISVCINHFIHRFTWCSDRTLSDITKIFNGNPERLLCLLLLEHCNGGFEPHSRYKEMYVCVLYMSVLSCGGRSIMIGWSSVQGFLQNTCTFAETRKSGRS